MKISLWFVSTYMYIVLLVPLTNKVSTCSYDTRTRTRTRTSSCTTHVHVVFPRSATSILRVHTYVYTYVCIVRGCHYSLSSVVTLSHSYRNTVYIFQLRQSWRSSVSGSSMINTRRNLHVHVHVHATMTMTLHRYVHVLQHDRIWDFIIQLPEHYGHYSMEYDQETRNKVSLYMYMYSQKKGPPRPDLLHLAFSTSSFLFQYFLFFSSFFFFFSSYFTPCCALWSWSTYNVLVTLVFTRLSPLIHVWRSIL